MLLLGLRLISTNRKDITIQVMLTLTTVAGVMDFIQGKLAHNKHTVYVTSRNKMQIQMYLIR